MAKLHPPQGTSTHFLDDRGREVLDDTPVAPPVGYKPTPSMIDHVRAMVRQELSRKASEEGFETFEEADDFEVGDDYEPSSPYEERELEPPPPPADVPATPAPAEPSSGSSEAPPAPPNPPK